MPTSLPERRYHVMSLWLPFWLVARLVRRSLTVGYTLVPAREDAKDIGLLYLHDRDEPEAILIDREVIAIMVRKGWIEWPPL